MSDENLSAIQPHPGPQTEFFTSPAYEMLYGGAAGGGKSMACVLDPLRQVSQPGFRSAIFRRTFPEFELPKGIIELSKELYTGRGCLYNESKHRWHWPKYDSNIRFLQMENESDYAKGQGGGLHTIYFDELSKFTELQYRFQFSRLRKPAGSQIECYARATANPPEDNDPGMEWIVDRWAPWLDPDYESRTGRPAAKSGELRYYIQQGDAEIEVPKGTPKAWSRTFIAASWRDNLSLDQEDYERSLDMLPFIQRERQKNSNWTIKVGAGKVFSRDWFTQFADSMPDGVQQSRAWDLAATEKKLKNSNDPDWTSSTLIAQKGDKIFVQILRDRRHASKVIPWMYERARAESSVVVGFEHEQGASGKIVADQIVRGMAEMSRICHAISPRGGDKVQRAMPLSVLAEQGKIVLVKSPTVTFDEIIKEFHSFPDGKHDDMVDSTSLALHLLKYGHTSTQKRWGY